jgi:nicotinamidase-related amidase
MSKYTDPQIARCALITVDIQRDTLEGGLFEVPGTLAILPKVEEILKIFRIAGRPIVHTVRIYRGDASNVDSCRRGIAESGALPFLEASDGCQLPEEMLPQPGIRLADALLLSGCIQTIGPNEVVMYKPRWGAFFETPLEAYLKEREITTLVFCGCNYPNCPRASIYEASERDYRIILVEDAVSALYAMGTAEMRNIGVRLLPSLEVVRLVREQT